MRHGQIVTKQELATLAKEAREKAGVTQAEAAARIGRQQPEIALAENQPERGYIQLRIDLIHAFTDYEVEGPFYRLKKRKK